jgi:hypothetical protein
MPNVGRKRSDEAAQQGEKSLQSQVIRDALDDGPVAPPLSFGAAESGSGRGGGVMSRTVSPSNTERKRRRWRFVVLALVLVAAVGGVVAYRATRTKPTAASSATTVTTTSVPTVAQVEEFLRVCADQPSTSCQTLTTDLATEIGITLKACSDPNEQSRAICQDVGNWCAQRIATYPGCADNPTAGYIASSRGFIGSSGGNP